MGGDAPSLSQLPAVRAVAPLGPPLVVKGAGLGGKEHPLGRARAGCDP